MPKTLFQKIWDSHIVAEQPDSPAVLYIDLHLVHEVTSPQAFTGLRQRGLKVRRPELTLATMDHSIPTTPIAIPIADGQIVRRNVGEFVEAQVPYQIPEDYGVRFDGEDFPGSSHSGRRAKSNARAVSGRTGKHQVTFFRAGRRTMGPSTMSARFASPRPRTIAWPDNSSSNCG